MENQTGNNRAQRTALRPPLYPSVLPLQTRWDISEGVKWVSPTPKHRVVQRCSKLGGIVLLRTDPLRSLRMPTVRSLAVACTRWSALRYVGEIDRLAKTHSNACVYAV